MELKNILSRQPGSEIHQQLASYKDSLKEKTAQMKKMLAELKNSQDSVEILKFENSRLRGELARMKQDYFKKRREEDKVLYIYIYNI
jgi:regulator of replication initiation timing